MFVDAGRVQLAFDSADRLIELVESRQSGARDRCGSSAVRTPQAPTTLARSLLEDIVAGDARLRWVGADLVGLAGTHGLDVPVEEATFVVFDLETTGLKPGAARICEIGAQRIQRLELTETYATLVNPGRPLPPAITALTGIRPGELRGAPRVELAVRRFLAFADDAVLVAHNARFDLGFLDREVQLLTGRRVAAPVVDTVWLARRVLGDRLRRVGLSALAHFFGVPTEPCHRALPDACATAEILLRLVGLAQERGIATVGELVEFSAPRARRLSTKRSLVAGAPSTPGTYAFHDRHGQVLYVGKARDLRARLRSYFAGGRQRPAVEAALGAVQEVVWEEAGSELEAALRELRLLRALRPPANARSTRPDRAVYLKHLTGVWSVSEEPTSLGPFSARRQVLQAARVLTGHESDDVAAALPSLEERLRRLAREQRFEDAARLRDRLDAVRAVARGFGRALRLRSLELCLLAPSRTPGFAFSVMVAGGRVACERLLPRGGGADGEARRAITEARWTERSISPEDAVELRLIGTFLDRPPPEMQIVALDACAVATALRAGTLAA